MNKIKPAQREILGHCKKKWRKRTMISVPTEGWIRYEWAHARYSQCIPMNWEASGFDLAYTAIGYSIDDAYNVIVKNALEKKVDWLITIEDDVLIPHDFFIKFNEYTEKAKYPIVSGLYYMKGSPTAPLVFRGRGNGAYTDWKMGDKVWCDGLPMGALLIHTSILKWFWERTEQYKTPDGQEVRRVFETPRKVFYDPEQEGFARFSGTQDLYFFDRVLEHDVLKKTGWGNVNRIKATEKGKYPFLCDTSIFCRHIDRQTGRQWP